MTVDTKNTTKQEIKGGESDRYKEGEKKEKNKGRWKVKRKGGVRGKQRRKSGALLFAKPQSGKERPEGKPVSFHIQNYPEVISQPSTFCFCYLSLLKFSH